MELGQKTRKFVATNLALLAGMGAGAAIDYELGLTPNVPRIANELSQITGNIPTCPTPSPLTMHTVGRLFSSRPLDKSPRYWGETYSESSAEIAERLGLTLPDNYLADKLDRAPENRPFNWDFAVAGAYLAQFGVRLSVAGPNQFDKSTGTMPTRADLANFSTKYALEDIVGGLQYVPLQYVRATGLKHVVLTDITDNDIQGMALTKGKDNTVLVDPRKGGDLNLMPHEMEHLIDAKECGAPLGNVSDPAYTALNGGNIYHSNEHEKDADEITVEGTLADDVRNFAIASNSSIACKEEEIYKRALPKAVAYSDYGLTDLAEDKATIGANIAFPETYGEVLSKRTPIIRKKFEIIMARLYDINPRLVRYFAGVSTRPAKKLGLYIYGWECPSDK